MFWFFDIDAKDVYNNTDLEIGYVKILIFIFKENIINI